VDNILPWAAIGAALLALMATARPWSASARAERVSLGPTQFWQDLIELRPLVLGSAALAAVAALAGALWGEKLPGMREVGYGVVIGALHATLAEVCGLALADRAKTLLAPLGLAVGFVGAASLASADILAQVLLGLVLGSSLTAALLSMGSKRTPGWGRLSAFYGTALSLACLLGLHREGVARASEAPVAIGVFAVIAVGVAYAVTEFVQKQRGKDGLSPFWGGLVGLLVLSAGAKLMADRYLFLGQAAWVCIGALVAAWFVCWVIPDEREHDAGSFAIAGLIWLAWTTVAFGLMQGYGIALSGLCAASFIYLMDARRAMVSLGIVMAISFYRLFLQEYPKEARAIDIGQQYAVMGLFVGAALPIALGSWGAKIRDGFKGFSGFGIAVLAGLVGIGIVLGLSFVIGSRGAVGFLIGLGVSAFALGLGGAFRFGIVSLSSGLAAALVIGFGHIVPYITLEREAKIRLLGWALGIAVLILLLAELLLRRPNKVVASEEMA
jgi:hypothetical protein